MSLHKEVEQINDGFVDELESQKRYFKGLNYNEKAFTLDKLIVYLKSIANMKGHTIDDDVKEKIEEAYAYLNEAEKSILKSELGKDISKKNIAFIIKLISKSKKARRIIREDMIDKEITVSDGKNKMKIPPLEALDMMVDKKSNELTGFDIEFNAKKRKPVGNSNIVTAVDEFIKEGNLPKSRKINKLVNKIDHIKKEDLEKNKAELEMLKMTELSNSLDPKKYKYTKIYVDRLIKKRGQTLAFKTMYLNSFDITEINNAIMGRKYHEVQTEEENVMKR